MNMRARLTLLAIVALLALSAAVRAQGDDIFSPEAEAREVKALSRLRPADKLKVRRAFESLRNALAVSSVSSDPQEIARASGDAGRATDAAEMVIPDGVLKGSLGACKKALGHYFILRLFNAGNLRVKLPPEDDIEAIALRYQLASVPAYDRPARVLEHARAYLLIADGISARAGIVRRGVKPRK